MTFWIICFRQTGEIRKGDREMSTNSRLSTPRESRRSFRPNYDPETFGQLSEKFARFLGTARFLVYMTIFVAAWIFWNVFAPNSLRFDEYPFI